MRCVVNETCYSIQTHTTHMHSDGAAIATRYISHHMCKCHPKQHTICARRKILPKRTCNAVQNTHITLLLPVVLKHFCCCCCCCDDVDRGRDKHARVRSHRRFMPPANAYSRLYRKRVYYRCVQCNRWVRARWHRI